jgi:serine/threonine protein phosphatase PrpC
MKMGFTLLKILISKDDGHINAENLFIAQVGDN